jgi:hypothetical protein
MIHIHHFFVVITKKVKLNKQTLCDMWRETADVELPKILNAQIKKRNFMFLKGRNVHKSLF